MRDPPSNVPAQERGGQPPTSENPGLVQRLDGASPPEKQGEGDADRAGTADLEGRLSQGALPEWESDGGATEP